MPIALSSFQTLELRGPEAIAFAQAQFSSDVRKLANGQWQFSAWLSPQGRVRAFFHLLRDDDEHLRVILRGTDASEMATALQRFVFRSKVALHVADDLHTFGTTSEQAVVALCGSAPASTAIAGNREHSALALPGDASRWLVLLATGSAAECTSEGELDPNHWWLSDIHAGLPELTESLQEQFLPQWIGLDRLGAVSVKKGCYPGQEIIARMHFKGGNKRGLYLVEVHGDSVPAAGAQIAGGANHEANAGRIVMAAQSAGDRIMALASLHDELAKIPLRISDASGSEIGVLNRFG